MPRDDFQKIGRGVLDICLEIKFASTKSEARRFIESGGFRINDEQMLDPWARICMFEGVPTLVTLEQD